MSGTRSDRPMDRSRLEALVAAYGARPRAWPEEERDAALACLAESPEVQAIVDRERELDALLGEAPSLDVSRALGTRIAASLPPGKPGWAERLDVWAAGVWPFGRNWQPAGALLTAAALGLVAGLVLPQPDDVPVSSASSMTDDVLVIEEYAALGDLP